MFSAMSSGSAPGRLDVKETTLSYNSALDIVTRFYTDPTREFSPVSPTKKIGSAARTPGTATQIIDIDEDSDMDEVIKPASE